MATPENHEVKSDHPSQYEKIKRSSFISNIPNLFTLLNLIFGCLSIIFILQTGETIVMLEREGFTQVNLPEKISWGAVCIFGAAIVDFLDGFLARVFKAVSSIGKQLDSLADLVSFGVAPAMILYQLLRISYAQEKNGLDIPIVWLLPALLLPCAAAWRLAKFNLDDEQQFSFKGMPTPAVGLVIASFPLMILFQSLGLQNFLINKWIIYLVIFLMSFLMISKISFMSLKLNDKSLKKNFPRILLLVIAIVSLIILKWAAMPVIFLAYVIISLLLKNKVA